MLANEQEENLKNGIDKIDDEYLIPNTILPNLLNMSNVDIGNSQYDFYIKSKCVYLAESEIDGMIFLKKDKIVFRSTTGIDKSMVDHLTQLDAWLY